MDKTICIVGTGGFARETFTIVRDLNKDDKFEAFLEPDDIWENKWKGRSLMNYDVLPLAK